MFSAPTRRAMLALAAGDLEGTQADRDEVRLAPCRTCRVNGELDRLAWEAPRRNKYRRAR